VVKDIADSVRLVKDNFTAGLLAYANGVITDNPDGYKAQIEMAREAGQPILNKDSVNLSKAMADAVAQGVAEAERKAKAKARRVAVTA
jgi:formate dehydrogenase maturation protein FdhE